MSADSVRKAMATKLREAREYLSLSQEEVASILKIPRSAISLIEKGERRVDAVELKEFARIYQTSVSFFTGDELANDNVQAKYLARLSSTARNLSDQDFEELNRFAQFLREKGRRK